MSYRGGEVGCRFCRVYVAGGVYLKDSDVAVIDDGVYPMTPDKIVSDANSAMLDPEDARRLWDVTEKLLA